ncbi:hypothetical protein LCGC14_0394310 [marine sediment metagenome]|uniref:Uncharacterized protein n=1 Tax=marine sediment metagenome TaxID=412755 RepID=A0A0F9VKR1_9ZZZZ
MSKEKEGPMAGVETPEIVAPAPEENDKQAPAHDAEMYLVMERRDEAQIVEALEGRYIEEFVYEFESGGRKVTGLSWMGIQEASREYGGIVCPIEKMIMKLTKTHVAVTIEAKDIKTGSVRIGHSKQQRRMSLRSGKFLDDEFAEQKAISKAQRNAIRQLLPQTLLKQWIERHRSGTGSAAKPKEAPKAAEKKEAPSNGGLEALMFKMESAETVADLSAIINESVDIWNGLKGKDKAEFNAVRARMMDELKSTADAGQKNLL